MEKFVYYAPTEIVFGKDTWKECATYVKKYHGNRVFVIYGGHSAKKSGLLDNIVNCLQEGGLQVMTSGGVVPNPLVSTARKMVKEAIAFNADFILAIGGGSVIDTAKGVAHGVASPDVDLWDYWLQKASVTKSLPIGAVLTISAAGSETSDSSVLTDDTVENPTKRGLNTPFNRCVFTIMDPTLTMSLPKYQIGAGAADIFMHTSERYFAKILGNHLTDEIAGALFRDIIEYGPKGVVDPSDYEAMSEIMWCGSISHVGLTGLGAKGDTPRDGDWSCHALGMAMSAIYDSTHGATLSAIWGSWARYVRDANIERFASFAKLVYNIDSIDPYAASEEAIVKTEQFFASLGMPISLPQLFNRPLTEEEIQALVKECSFNKTRKIGSFKVLDDKDMYNIYTKANQE